MAYSVRGQTSARSRPARQLAKACPVGSFDENNIPKLKADLRRLAAKTQAAWTWTGLDADTKLCVSYLTMKLRNVQVRMPLICWFPDRNWKRSLGRAPRAIQRRG